jgi:hypothetical protein
MAKNDTSTHESQDSTGRLEAFITRDYQVENDTRTEWTKVGIAFQHKSRKGFTLHITPGLSVSGDIILREPRPKDSQSPAPSTED